MTLDNDRATQGDMPRMAYMLGVCWCLGIIHAPVGWAGSASSGVEVYGVEEVTVPAAKAAKKGTTTTPRRHIKRKPAAATPPLAKGGQGGIFETSPPSSATPVSVATPSGEPPQDPYGVTAPPASPEAERMPAPPVATPPPVLSPPLPETTSPMPHHAPMTAPSPVPTPPVVETPPLAETESPVPATPPATAIPSVPVPTPAAHVPPAPQGKTQEFKGRLVQVQGSQFVIRGLNEEMRTFSRGTLQLLNVNAGDVVVVRFLEVSGEVVAVEPANS